METARWYNGTGLPLKGVMDGKGRAAGQHGLQLEGEEDQDVEDELFNNPFGALVKNCNMLHNIVGPACVFLKRGFSQTLVCNRTQSGPPFFFLHSCWSIFIPASWLTLLLCVIPSPVRVRWLNLLAPDISSMEIIDGLCGASSKANWACSRSLNNKLYVGFSAEAHNTHRRYTGTHTVNWTWGAFF